MARIDPLEAPFEPDVAALLRTMMPDGVEPIALFRTFAKHPSMAEAMHPWGRYELGRHLSISKRDREIVIDRTTARRGCEYEWGVHVAFFAASVGFDDDQVRSLTHGTSTDPCWTDPRERMLIDLVDSLCDTADVDDELWNRLAATFTEPQLLDLQLLCGWYHAISFVARASRVPLEAGAPTFAAYA